MTISYVLGLTEPLLTLSEWGAPEAWLTEEIDELSVRDLILLVGGLFLIWKSVHEIHKRVDGHDDEEGGAGATASFSSVMIQVALMDIIFSLDSVITAVGMANNIWVIVLAVIAATVVMLIFAEQISRFVERHPTIKILALSFLILIGVMLVAEGVGTHFNKGYIYFAMAFALGVEMINLRVRPASSEALEGNPSK